MEFIDRTIFEILSLKPNTDPDDIHKYVKYLKTLGINIIEIDGEKFDSSVKFVNSGNMLLRIEEVESLKGIRIEGLYGILLTFKSLWKTWNRKKNENCIGEWRKLTSKIDRCFLEIDVESLKEFLDVMSAEDNLLKSILDNLNIYCIRVRGLSLCIPFYFPEDIDDIKERYKIKIDICAENTHNCATAAAVEAACLNTDYITAAFCGFGVNSKFAALEEVLLALRVICGMDLRADTKMFPELKNLFKKMTGTNISEQKPVLGESIFMCESGIHVDGILKDPSIYEPYSPELIGQKRQITLGKHTGKAAVLSKLAELNLKLNGADINEVVDKVRMLSMKNGGRLANEHLQQAISSVYPGGV